ncbi:MAG: hypothetical protein ABIR29_08965 [Chthoniobacterales bacterium]
MRFLPHLLIVALFASSVGARAQSATTPDNTSVQASDAQLATSAAVPSPAPSGTESVEPPSLIPPNILPAPESVPKIPVAPELDLLNSYFKSTSLGKAADEHRLHLQMATLEIRIRNDEDLHALKAAAMQAPTDLERRHRLKDYYEHYFGNLSALATTPDLKAYVAAQLAARKLSLLQPRVRHESDAAEAAALSKVSQGAVTALPTPVQARAGQVVRP